MSQPCNNAASKIKGFKLGNVSLHCFLALFYHIKISQNTKNRLNIFNVNVIHNFQVVSPLLMGLFITCLNILD